MTRLPRNRPRLYWPFTALLACLSLLAATGLSPQHAEAQEYFRVSPGPLSVSHADLDHSAGCANCHVSAKGVINAKCLVCHTALVHSGGLHAGFGGKACIDCHVEHKGRSHGVVNWSTIGGRDSFNHTKTGFALTNEHSQIACTKCHVRRLKSGGTSYLGLSRDCQSCHKGAHSFSSRELSNNCGTCHAPGQGIRGQKLSAWLGPHGRYSGVSLEGKHRDLACTECHPGANMAGRTTPRSCADCHTPTHPVTPATERCTGCHSQGASMRSATIDHAKFGFPLTGRHARVQCSRCHQTKGGSQLRAARRAVRSCVDCHIATHPVVPATANCAKCHSPTGSFKGAKIDHEKLGLPLRGKHERLSCARCHKKQKRLDYSEGACTNCHAHRRAHNGQFADKPCASCHVEGGKRNTPFDHNLDSRFPLVGFHAAAKVRDNCKLCHPGGLYRTKTIACRDCHEDPHRGEFGADCAKCHSPKAAFGSTRASDVDHSAFPLEGKHKTIPCSDCHAGGKYDLKNPRCVDCHREDDVHRGSLGEDCGKCHLPTKGAPKFRHDTMTGFALAGAHRKVGCSECHQGSRGARFPLSVAQWKRLPPPPLDRGFHAPGRRCVDCHANPHRSGRATNDCAKCHLTTSFRSLRSAQARAIIPLNHRGTWLRRHTTLPEARSELGADEQNCATCHGSPGCRNCHRTDKPRSHTGLWRMRTHGAQASYDVSGCRVCHQTAACTQCHQRTRPLNHRGAWPTLHGYAAGGFGASNCSVCHRRAFCLECHVSR